MSLRKYNLGELIEQTIETNSQFLYHQRDVKGMTIDKRVISTKADVENADLKKFLIIKPNEFIYNPRTHGKKIGLAFNDLNSNFIISWNNIGFRVKEDKKNILLPKYLFIYFNRDEWDRNACFMSWGSSTEVFSWNEFIHMSIDLPPIEIQKKYVAIYDSLVRNQKSCESSLNYLKQLCVVYVENLRRTMPLQEIGKYLIQTNERCENNSVIEIMGISNEHCFKKPNSRVDGVDIYKYKIVKPNEFGWSPIHINEGSIALNSSNESYAISPIYNSFKTDSNYLLSEYLDIFFQRDEFIRYCWFNAYGSARDTVSWDDLARVKIPIPNLTIQKSISKVFSAYSKRKDINEKLKAQVQKICPILIRGAIYEASKS